MLAVSTDREITLTRFKASVGGEGYRFVADPDAELARLYEAKMPLVKVANRKTFVIGTDGRILAILSGSDALDPAPALDACPIPG